MDDRAVARPILELCQVTKKYAATLGVGPIDFEVQRGEFLTLLGPSGCGKTTTLHIIAGLVRPDAGSVVLNGSDITALDPPHRDMGVVFQNYALFPHKTVYENVAFGLRMRRVPRAEIEMRVERVINLVGLPGVLKRYPHQLSGGQRQRVAVARALVIEPTLLLFDEPLSNLDAALRKRMRLELRELQQRLEITTLFVTHDQDEAFEMSDRVVLLENGRIVQIGKPEDLYDSPASRFAAEFIGDINVIEGAVVSIVGNVLEAETSNGWKFRADAAEGIRAGDAVDIIVRPERIEIGLSALSDGSGIPLTVRKRVFSGDRIDLHLSNDTGLSLRCRKPSAPPYRDLHEGAQIWAVAIPCKVLPRARVNA